MVTDRHRGYGGYLLQQGRHAPCSSPATPRTPMRSPGSDARGQSTSPFCPIGAYDPWIANHASPEQAWRMFRGLGAEYRAPGPPLDLPAEPRAGGRAARAVARCRRRRRAGGSSAPEVGATWRLPTTARDPSQRRSRRPCASSVPMRRAERIGGAVGGVDGLRGEWRLGQLHGPADPRAGGCVLAPESRKA